MTSPEEHSEILRLLKENTEVVKQNNILLRKLHRWSVWGFVLRSLWYVIIIGFPFALYFYLVEPYFNALGANYDVFRLGIAEIPGLKGLEHILPKVGE